MFISQHFIGKLLTHDVNSNNLYIDSFSLTVDQFEKRLLKLYEYFFSDYCYSNYIFINDSGVG